MEGLDQKPSHSSHPSQPKNFFSTISHELLANPRKDDYKHMTSCLKNVNFFKRIFPDFIELHDFVHLSKGLFTYETHPYGTIINKKGDYAEKFYIILKGEVQKFQQRKYKEIEDQLKHQMSHRASCLTQDTSRLISNPNKSPTGGASFKRSDKNKRTLTWFTNDSTRIFPNNMQTSIDVSNGDIASPGSESPVNMERKFRRSPTRTRTLTFPSANEIPQDDQEILNFDNMALINQIRANPSEDQQVKKGRPRLDSRIKLIPRADVFPKFSPSRLSYPQDFSDISIEFPGLKMSATSPSPTKDFSRHDVDVSNIVEPSPNKEEDTNLLTRLILKHPEIRHTCFIHNVPLLTSMKTCQPGDHFGENSCKKVQGREPIMTVVSSEEVHLLGINRNDFRNIIDIMDKEANIRADFFRKLLHGVEENLIKTFSQYFKKINLPKSHQVYQQNDPATAFYIIQSGEVELSKENPRTLPKSSLPCISPTSHRKTAKQELSIALVGNDQFFGEELLFEEQLRNYTATVKSPSLECYCLEENLYLKIKNHFREIFQEIKLQSNTKLKWRRERLTGLVETQNISPQLSPKRSLANDQVLELFKLLSINSSESRSKLNNFRNIPMPGTPQQSNSTNSSPISGQAATSPKDDQVLAQALKSYKDNYSRKPHLSLKLYLADEQPQSAEKPPESPSKITLNSPTNPGFLDFGIQFDNKKPLRAKKLTLIKSGSNPNPPILPIGSPRMQKIKLPNDSLIGKVTPLQPNKWEEIANAKTMTEFNPYLTGKSQMVLSPRTTKIQQQSTTIFGFEEKMNAAEEELTKEAQSAGSSPIDKREFKKLRELIHYRSITELQGKLRREKKEKEKVVNIHTQEPISKSYRQTK